MNRRIILLSYTKHIHDNFLKGLKDALLRHGHEVRSVFHHGEPADEREVRCEWASFDLSAIEGFRPDRVIIFNGFAKETFGVTSYIRARYKTFFVERGWLPQQDNIYIDHLGLGARSSLAMTDLTMTKALSRKVENTVGDLHDAYYRTNGHPELGDYILAPLQLDHDTSIILDSPFFKTMESFMFFLKKSFPGYKVIVTKHPHNPDAIIPEGLVFSSYRTLDLAKTAKAVIGINSTSLIESLIHGVPVGQLGRNVISGSNMMLQPDLLLSFPQNLFNRFNPDAFKTKCVLFSLLNRQFNRFETPDIVVKQIEV